MLLNRTMSGQKSNIENQKSNKWRPLRDSNPCCRRERAGAFAENRQLSDKNTGFPVYVNQWVAGESLNAATTNHARKARRRDGNDAAGCSVPFAGPSPSGYGIPASRCARPSTPLPSPD